MGAFNKLAIKLFLEKYYDLVFLVFLILIFVVLYLISKFGKRILKTGFVYKFLQFVKNKKLIPILAIITVFMGLLVRLYKIGNPVADWHSFRQADTASVTRVYAEEGINLLIPRYHDISTTQSGLFNPEGYRFVEFPIFNAIHALLLTNFGIFSLEVWGRLLSIISALISSYLLYLLGKKYIGDWGGLLSMFFYLFIPFNIYFTRVILPEPMAVMFALASVYLFLKFLDDGYGFMIYSSSICLALALLIKPYTIFYGIPILYLAYDKWGVKLVKRGQLVIFLLIALMPFILWRDWMRNFPEGIPFWKWTFNGDGIRFRPAFWYWLFGERLGKLILGVWGIIPFIFGLAYKKVKGNFILVFLFGMFLYVSIFATANVRHDYYQTLVIPAVTLALSAGVINIWKREDNLLRAILIVSIVLMFLIGSFQVKEFYKINHPEIVTTGARVDELLPKDELIIAPYYGDTAFLYQTKRKGWPVVDRPIDDLIGKGAKYFVSVNLDHPQTIEYAQRFEVIEKTVQYIIIKLK